MIDYGYYDGMLSIGSDLDEDTRETYTEGDCYLLALELHLLGLGELVAVVDPLQPVARRRAWTHMAVRTLEGYILDADGLNEPGIALSNYGHELPQGGVIEAITLEDYGVLIDSKAESIHSTPTVKLVALELKGWLQTVPPLAPLAH